MKNQGLSTVGETVNNCYVNFSRNELGNEGVTIVARFLKRNMDLVCLNLSNNNLSSEGL